MDKDLLAKSINNLANYRPKCFQKADITFICTLCKWKGECEYNRDD